ncbi:MAG: small basic family protein [Firmicutes bacterium]|jgi:small basic protein|nr:small basic family protein [Bacillota bacterium]
MILPAIGLIAGIVIALFTPLRFPTEYSQYIAIGILAALDCVFGGIRAGLQNTFDKNVFISGFLVNTALAATLTVVGDKLGVDLVLGATVAFSIRIFTNVGIIRRYILDKWFKNACK